MDRFATSLEEASAASDAPAGRASRKRGSPAAEDHGEVQAPEAEIEDDRKIAAIPDTSALLLELEQAIGSLPGRDIFLSPCRGRSA
mmetsp:Transcript_36975/g.76867  ORF Transcript_36975/g.76867 Transcript_36975/m.76867 type:complete len:86 (+) Transcript_36975:410-667(+)